MTYERDADELAMAGHLQEQLNDAGVAAVRRALKPQVAEGFDGHHCVVCEDALPPIRIEMGRVRCTTCQIVEDARLKLRR